MGFWNVIYSAGDGLKGMTPDLSTAKRTAYDCTSAAVNKIDQTIRVDGIQKYLPDDETRSQIGVFTTTLAKNTGKYVVYEGFKHIPGATVANKLISDTMLEMKQENHKISPEEISRQKLNLSSNHGGGGETKNMNKDIINTFINTEFVGNHMFRDLMVPKLPHMEKKSINDGNISPNSH